MPRNKGGASSTNAYADMLNWEQRIKSEKKSADEWEETWGHVYTKDDKVASAKTVEDKIAAVKKALEVTKRQRAAAKNSTAKTNAVKEAENRCSSNQFRRQKGKAPLGGAAQPIY